MHSVHFWTLKTKMHKYLKSTNNNPRFLVETICLTVHISQKLFLETGML